jgi:hypothetical protein
MRTKIPAAVAEDPWFKVVDMLQQNWAVILEEDVEVLVVFYGDTCGVFDELRFDSSDEAKAALLKNGFRKYKEDERAQGFIALPQGSFQVKEHPNGRIYSSGRFWL